MNSLTELNGYVSNLNIEFTDTRVANVTFTTPNAVNQSQSVDKGFPLSTSIGIEIDEILNASISNPTFTINIFELTGATLTWPTLPSGVTASTPSTGVYRLSGISSKAIWDAIKVATINLPPTFSGIWTYSCTIAYYSQVDGNQTKSWTTAVTVNNVVFLTTPLEFTYSASTTALVTNTTQIINVDAAYPGVIWTVIGTPSNNTAISTWTTTGTGGTFSVNATSKIFTVSGTRAQVNSRLSGLTLTTTSIDLDFSLTYDVTNNLNAVTDNAIQTFASYNLTKLSNPSSSYFIEDAAYNVITGSPTVIDTPYDGTGTYSLVITPSTTSAVTTVTSDPVSYAFVNAGTAINSTSQAQFGTASILTNGLSTSFISTSTNTNTFNFSDDDFTIDFWIKIPASTISGGILSKIGSSVYGAHLGWSITLQNGYIEFISGVNPPNNAAPLVGVFRQSITSRLPANTWTHIAFVAKDNVLSTFVNGYRESQTALPTIADSTGNLQIGKGYYWNDGLGGSPGYWRETWTAAGDVDPFPVRAWTAGGAATVGLYYSHTNAGVKNWYQVTSVNDIGGRKVGNVLVEGINNSSGFTTGAVVTFSVPQLPGGIRATGTVVASGGKISSITITNPGAGYLIEPTITATTGTLGTTILTSVFAADVGTFSSTAPTFTSGTGASGTYGVKLTWIALGSQSTINGTLNGGYIDELRISDNARYVDETFTLPAEAYSWDINTKLLMHFNGANNSTAFTVDTTQTILGTQSFNNSTKVLTLSGTRTQLNTRLPFLRMTNPVDWSSDFALTYALNTPRDETASKVQSILCGSNDIEITNMNVVRPYFANRANQIFSTSTPVITDFDLTEGNIYTIAFTSALGEFAFGSADVSVSTLTFSGTKAQCNAKFVDVRFYPNSGVFANGTFTYTQIKNGVTQVTQTVSLTGTYSAYSNARTFLISTSQTFTPNPADVKYGRWDLVLVGGGGSGGYGKNVFVTPTQQVTVGMQGGGGGGQVLQLSDVTITNQTYSITVGEGGTTLPTGNVLRNGGNTVAFGYTAQGGKHAIELAATASDSYYRSGGASGNGNLGAIGYISPINNANFVQIGGGGGGAGSTIYNDTYINTTNIDFTSTRYPARPTASIVYSGISGSSITGSGSGATFNFTILGSNVTTTQPFITVTIANGGSGYTIGDRIRIQSSLIGGWFTNFTPSGDGPLDLNYFDVVVQSLGQYGLTVDATGGKGVYIEWEANANSIYGWYGGGGSGASQKDRTFKAASGSIGNLITFTASGKTQTNGLTFDAGTGSVVYTGNTINVTSVQSGSGGGAGGFTGGTIYPEGGSGIIGVRITSKG